MATPVNDNYLSPSGEQINAGQWAVADYDASAALSSDVAGSANPGDTYTITANLTNLGALALGGTVFIDEIEDGNLTLVPGSATTNIGSVTQDDTRIEIAVGPLATSAIITYQVTINAGMPDGYVSSRGTLDATNLAAEFSSLLIEQVVAGLAANWEDISANWSNLSFEAPVLGVGAQATATDWTNLNAWNPDSGPGPVDGAQVGLVVNTSRARHNSLGNGGIAANQVVRITAYAMDNLQNRSVLPNVCFGNSSLGFSNHPSARYLTKINSQGAFVGCHFYGAIVDSLESVTATIQVEVPNFTGTIAYDKLTIEKWIGPTVHAVSLYAHVTNGFGRAGFLIMPLPRLMGPTEAGIDAVLLTPGDSVGIICSQIGDANTDEIVQSTPTRRPLLQANGSLLFDGVDDYLGFTSTSSIGSDVIWTHIIRIKFLSMAAGNRVIFSVRRNAESLRVIDSDGSLGYFDGSTVHSVVAGYRAAYVGVDHCIIFRSEAGNDYIEIVGGPLAGVYPATWDAHPSYRFSDIGSTNTGIPPHMEFYGFASYTGAETAQLKSEIVDYLNMQSGSSDL